MDASTPMAVDAAPEAVCEHLSLLRDETTRRDILAKYTLVRNWSTRRDCSVLHATKRRKIASPACNVCGLSASRLFACLLCDFVGCWRTGHIASHQTDAVHILAADVKTGAVLCSACEDIVYEEAFESILAEVEENRLAHVQDANKSRQKYQAWSPNEKEVAVLGDFEPVQCQGRRGLLNLGQTCYLNVVLQSLVHNPLIRNHFLSDKHNHRLCKLKDCIGCELDSLISEIYAGELTPFGPTNFLATMWRTSAELSGYTQQDAHECYMSMLNQIHKTSRGSTDVSCNCIVHNTFAGQLQSDVTCESCGNVNTTVDPTFDISLELKSKGGDVPADLTLSSCLTKYTRPEKLDAKDYNCSKCDRASQGSTKRLSIRILPPVLSFQFKRFEHKSGDRGTAQKIDAPVRFPASINMAQHTTLYMNTTGNDDNLERAPNGRCAEPQYEYDLFAVICHEGNLENGHYYNFARSYNEWYRFDDDKVSHASLDQCLNSQAYMCHYVKRRLDYQQHSTPSYRLKREVEARMEEEHTRARESVHSASEMARELEEPEGPSTNVDEDDNEEAQTKEDRDLEDELLATL